MTIEQKQAVQGLILNELARRQKDEPGLLFDVLMGNYGRQFVSRVVHGQWQMSSGATATLANLMQAMRLEYDPIEEYRRPEAETEEVA